MKASSYILRDLLYLLMFMALAVQSMIPTGFMPGHDQNGAAQIVICTSMGMTKVAVDNGTPSHDHGQKEKPSHICPYATVLAGDVPTSIQVLAAHTFASSDEAPAIKTWAAHAPQKGWTAQAPPSSLMHV